MERSVVMDTAIRVKFGMLEEHIKRPGEYGYNKVVTQYFESEGDFFEAWGENLPGGLPRPAEEDSHHVIHKPFGTMYVDDDGIPVACVSVEECPVEEAMRGQRR
jgi:hypothetical protein